MRGDADIALIARRAQVDVFGRRRRHRHAEHGEDGGDKNRRAEQTGFALVEYHCRYFFIIAASDFLEKCRIFVSRTGAPKGFAIQAFEPRDVAGTRAGINKPCLTVVSSF